MLIDATGQPCPIPVVKVKQAVAGLPAAGGTVRILVDNRTACENLNKLAAGSGYGFSYEPHGEGRYLVSFRVEPGDGEPDPFPEPERAPSAPPAADGGLVVAIGRDSMGSGSEELGKILLKGFLFSLTRLEPPPRALLFFNAGAHLTAEGSAALDDLRELAGKGTRVLTCGTCVDYYGIRERVAAGEIADMYTIVEEMSRAAPLINL